MKYTFFSAKYTLSILNSYTSIIIHKTYWHPYSNTVILEEKMVVSCASFCEQIWRHLRETSLNPPYTVKW